MATRVTYRKLDRNRYVKTYPFVQKVPRFVTITDNTAVEIEVGEVSFNNDETVVYTFMKQYSTPPTVAIGAKTDSVNIWIESITVGNVVFRSSSPTNASVYFQVVQVSG